MQHFDGKPKSQGTRRFRTLSFCAALFACAWTAPGSASAASPAEKLDRQIGIMERVIDKALIDSPYFLVSRGDNTRGLHLSGYGAIFTFDASLVHRSEFGDLVIRPGSDLIVRKDGDDGFVIRKRGIRDWLGREGREQEKENRKNVGELYSKGKDELMTMLLDYGEALSGLSSGEFVTVVARLSDEYLKEEKSVKRLVLRARIDDLKAYDEGRLGESEAKSRIQIEES